MKNTPTTSYEVIVIGAGAGGLTSAIGCAKAGKRVLLVERSEMGGECTNSGCIPSKTLLHHAKAYHAAKHLSGDTPSLEAYRAQVLATVRAKILEVRAHEEPPLLEKMGITVVRGEAVFVRPCVVQVGGVAYDFKTAIIASGSAPRLVPIAGLSPTRVLTNEDIFTLPDIPPQLLILGAGPIGMELGQAYALLGSTVTLVARENRLASLEDSVVSRLITQRFEALGITTYLNASLTRVAGNRASVEYTDASGGVREASIPFTHVLMAIGRVPNLPQGLRQAGILYDAEGVIVDSQYRTSNKDVYAVGDVVSGPRFTHVADDAARQVVTRLVSRTLLRVSQSKAIPKVIYTDPEIASVGLTHDGACKKYRCEEVVRIEVPYSSSDRARTDDVTEGVVVVTARRYSGTILGATIVGAHAGELIALCTLAIDRKLSLWAMRRTIYAYPTHAVLIKKAGDMFFAHTVSHLRSDIKDTLRHHAPKFVALFFWAILLIAFFSYRIEHQLSYREMVVLLYEFVTTTAWGPVVYMLAYALRPLIFFPATLLTALSGVLFGLPLGILYTVIGENASANLAYWIGRYFGKNMKLEDTRFGNWVESLRARPFMSVLFMRLFYVPFDLTNYGSGILQVRWRAYALATLVGIMPGLVTFVALGAGIKDITSFDLSRESFDFVSLGIGVSVFALSLILSRVLRRWHAKEAKV